MLDLVQGRKVGGGGKGILWHPDTFPPLLLASCEKEIFASYGADDFYLPMGGGPWALGTGGGPAEGGLGSCMRKEMHQFD